MELLPVTRYREPRYPTHHILDEHPELLRLLPERWRRNALALTALGLCAGLVVGCRNVARADPGGTGRGAKPGTPASFVAPIFTHGTGRGATGCEVVNPPVFLSEEEARQVITEEAKTAGISFRAAETELSGLRVPVLDDEAIMIAVGEDESGRVRRRFGRGGDDYDKDGPYKLLDAVEEGLSRRLMEPDSTPPDGLAPGVGPLVATALPSKGLARNPSGPYPYREGARELDFPGGPWLGREGALHLDGSDGARSVHYEYVSVDDYRKGELVGPNGSTASVSSFDLQPAARALRWGLAASKPKGAYGVFYDPARTWDDGKAALGAPDQHDWKALEAEVKRLARADLRAQVRDFVEWLKGQGVI